MQSAPSNIRALRDEGLLQLDWPDNAQHRLPFHIVRGMCPCASCVNEFTGERMIDPATIPQDITPLEMSLVGNYAVRVKWSDNHDTGLFTWSYLRQLGEALAEGTTSEKNSPSAS